MGGEFSQEVLQSLGTFAPPRIVPRVPRLSRNGEPDSGISSARSTTTVPWGRENEVEAPSLPILDLPRPDSSLEAEHQF